MKMEIAIQDFIIAQELNKSSKYYVANLRRDLPRFAEWLKSTHGVEDTDDLQLTHLRSWVSHLQKTPNKYGRDYKDSTIHSYALNLGVFCHWLEQEGVIQKRISERFKLPKVEKEFIPTFTADDVEKLLDACECGYKDKPQLCKALTVRNRAIVSMLIDTGIRRSELAGLRLGDIDRELRLLVVHRKGNKWQQVPISRDGFKPLHEYLTKYRPYLAKIDGRTVARKEDAVFLANDGKPLTPMGITRLFETLSKRADIEGKKVSPHNCRRYMATTQLANGRSPLDVQRQMGHTTLFMTNHYASLSVSQLQRSHEEYSPLRAKDAAERQGEDKGYWDE